MAGGLPVQAGSIIDGVDGDKSRLTGKGSPFGAFLDAVIDRYADGSAMVDLILWTAKLYDGALVWMIGFTALLGTFTVTYTRVRIDESRRTMFDQGLTSLASRDVRLFLVMLGNVAGLGLATFLTIAVLTNAVALVRLASALAESG